MRSHVHDMSAFTGIPGPWGADTETVFSELSADSYYGSQSSPGDDFANESPERQVEEPQDGRRDKTPERLQLETLGNGGKGHSEINEAQDARHPTATAGEVDLGRAETSEGGAAATAADGEGRLGGSSSGAMQAPQDTRKGVVSTSLEEGDGAGSGAIKALNEERRAARRRDDEVALTAAASSPVESLSSLGTSSSTSARLGQDIDRSSSGIGVGNRPEESSGLGNREESFHSLMDSLPPGFVQCPGCPNVRLETVYLCSICQGTCHDVLCTSIKVSITTGCSDRDPGSSGVRLKTEGIRVMLPCRVVWCGVAGVRASFERRGGSRGFGWCGYPGATQGSHSLSTSCHEVLYVDSNTYM